VHEGADRAGGPVGVAAEEEGEFVAAEEYAEEEGEEEPAEPSVRAEQRQETARIAQEILETLLRQMEIRARVSIRTVGNPIVLDVETENGGLLIGRRGDTLSALQYIVNVLVGKRTRRWTKVVVDVEHWRERREETLRALALRQAERVRHQRRPIALDPMPANERRIIHLALQGHRDVTTHSEGEEPNRRLIITPKR
jgi:spoIIIJ-associated protein